MTPENAGDNFDLLVIPQLHHKIPGTHLTTEQFEHAKHDWANFTVPPSQPHDTWTIALAHLHQDTLTITSTIQVPKSA